MTDFTQQRILIAGGGKSGLAAARYLSARGAQVVISDANAKPAGVDFPYISQNETDADGFGLIIQSPGVPLEIPMLARARARGARIIGELELAAETLQGTIVGITGANGKTTTTALTGHIFRHAGRDTLVGGNIGTPITELVPASHSGAFVVLELSSFQLETVEAFRAHIGIVLNITPDHLDRHGTMERYIDAKARLVETLAPSGFAVLNAAEPNARSLASRTSAQVVWFNLDSPADRGVACFQDSVWLGHSPLMPVADIPIPGRHNVENVMAAAAAAWLAGISLSVIAEAVRSFPGVEHRIEFTRELDSVRYYNDSKATNVDAVQKALDSFPGPLWVILGGKDKNSDYRPLAPRLAAKARGILLIGAASPIIRRQFSEVAPSLPLTDCATLDVAIRTARRLAAAGDVVLLSPACASFDQYQSYEHRGRHFKELVQSL
jgi:UDP-N-acetylmuramoylalanine--D-glutamate ligase